MAKKRVGKFTKAFRQMAVDRLQQCNNIVELAKELGISRRLLYTWREQLEPLESGEGPPAASRESTLRRERTEPVAYQLWADHYCHSQTLRNRKLGKGP